MKTLSRITKGMFYLLLFPAVLGICGWQGWSWWSWASAPIVDAPLGSNAATANSDAPPANPSSQSGIQPIRIEIPEGSTAEQIGQDLQAAGLIRSLTAWNLWTRLQTLQNREGSFQAGIYELSPTEPLDSIADQIWRGEVVQNSFTIPEGWSIQQMA
ncbi:MAG: endolytic transglycosylase MltG, partial [Elainella sp.]